MLVGIDFGREHLDVDVQDGTLVGMNRRSLAPSLADPALAMRDALESPLRFPSLYRALTPDDHVTVVVDEHLPHREDLLPPLLEHLLRAKVALPSVTLLFATPTSHEQWLASLPSELRGVRVEVHDPTDRRHLAYLATTKSDRRIYVNRTTVDADQVIVLSRRGYDPLSGYSGAEAALFPALSDEATRSELWKHLSMEIPEVSRGRSPRGPLKSPGFWAHRFVQVIEGPGDTIAHIVGGMVETSPDGRLLDAHWRTEVERNADTVVVSIAGNPRGTTSPIWRALGCASRVVNPHGRIVSCRAAAAQGPAVELLRQSAEPEQILRALHEHPSPEMSEAFQWRAPCSRHRYIC